MNNQIKKIPELAWVKGSGSYSDIVLTSRIRLARNLVNIPFPPKARIQDLKKSQKLIDEAFYSHPYFKAQGKLGDKSSSLGFTKISFDELPEIDKYLLAEALETFKTFATSWLLILSLYRLNNNCHCMAPYFLASPIGTNPKQYP